MNDVEQWLAELGLSEYGGVFAENMVDFEVLPDLTDADLKDLGVPLGHRKKLLRGIEALKASSEESTSKATTVADAKFLSPSDAERRQLTVMFVDMVGSTRLSTELDPEDLRDLMRRYQDAVAGAVTRYGGHVAKYLGDGVLAYFGWPQAHEDQTERALRAGLDSITAVSGVKQNNGTPLEARAGVATGQVVIGDLVGEEGRDEDAVSGETPNLAARLEQLAKPGEVVIDDATRRLVGGTFEVDDLGSHELKGIGRPVPAWRVTGGRVAETRFDAIHSGQLTTFVGRENEINMLGDRWRQARDGEGQVVLLSGEAGIGKSRITQALRDLAVDDNPMRLRQQCAPYYTSTTLYPFIHQFEYAAGIAPEDPADVKLEKVEKLLALSTGAVAEVAPLIATLLAIPIEPKYPPLDVSPQQQMAQTLNVIVDQYIGLAARQPVLMIVEDVHWADPVSLDIIEMIIDRAQGAKIMVVITFRPEFVPNWRGHSHITSLALNRLGRGQCHAIIDAVTGGKLLPEEVRDQIVAKTDGVALFVEELTKTVLESDLVRDTGDKYELARPLSQLAIPTTLQDSLMARLDRLAPVKEVAQMGAAIGREFPHRLLEAVSPLDSGELENALNQLVDAELIFRRGVAPETNYTFKHALVRDAAYESLLKSRRQVLHQSLADILARHFPEVAEAEPEILAHHYTEAGMIEAAAGFWCRAGKRAAERWANSIAIDHLAKGLDLVATLPPSPERDRLELDLCIAYSPTMMAMEGFGSIKAERSCERARELSDSLDDFDSHFTATIGLWQINLLRGSVAVSKQYSDELWHSTIRSNNSDHLVQAHHSCWSSDLFTGDPVSCLEHAKTGYSLYDPDKHRRHKFVYGTHDPGVCGLNHQGLSNVILGHLDQSITCAEGSVELARDLAHPTSLVLSLFWATMCHHFRQNSKISTVFAAEGVALCDEFKIPGWGAGMEAILGWNQFLENKDADAAAALAAGMNRWQSEGNKVFWPWFLSLQSESERCLGNFDKSLAIVADGLALGERTGEHWMDAELLRERGESLLCRSKDAKDDAEAALRQAIDVARGQKASLLELKATKVLSRLLGDQNNRTEARDLLMPVYGGFSEGLDSPELMDAKALLDALT